jgi:predicted glycoside hydrolase/deacetylase ChbG (UPF0249 family)
LVLDGYFPPDILSVEQRSKSSQVEAEIRAQIAMAEAHGIEPSHLDNHMGSLYGLGGIQSHLPLVLRICAEIKLPFRFPRSHLAGDIIAENLSPQVRQAIAQVVALADELKVPLPDYLFSLPYEKLPGETYQGFRDGVCQRLRNLPAGIHELIVHPAKDSPELRAINPHWEKRLWEDQLLRDPVFRRALLEADVVQIDWREVRGR